MTNNYPFIWFALFLLIVLAAQISVATEEAAKGNSTTGFYTDDCGANAELVKCSGCEGTCEQPKPHCFLRCEPPKCQCIHGFVRDVDERCVTVSECKGAVAQNATQAATTSSTVTATRPSVVRVRRNGGGGDGNGVGSALANANLLLTTSSSALTVTTSTASPTATTKKPTQPPTTPPFPTPPYLTTVTRNYRLNKAEYRVTSKSAYSKNTDDYNEKRIRRPETDANEAEKSIAKTVSIQSLSEQQQPPPFAANSGVGTVRARRL